MTKLNNIVLVKQEESYTSKANFWDKDEMPVYNENNKKHISLVEKEYIEECIKVLKEN